jgi:hypothetical protein
MSYRPRLAVIATVYRPLSHADVIVTRWLEPRPTDPQYGWPVDGRSEPRTRIASIHIAQYPENDVGRSTMAQYGVPIYDTVRDALTLGGPELAVDGVILIGEHGNYRSNEFGQKMYPRRELFDQIVAVFRESGRSVPVFNDKHLSYDSASAQYMVDTAREMGFPLMAGSSIPIAGFLERWTMPDGTALDAATSVFYNQPEINGYHAVECLQSLVARRMGGESGIESVTAYSGDSFYEAAANGVWSEELVDAAIGQTKQSPPDQYWNDLRAPGPSQGRYALPVGYSFQHLDGLRTTHLMVQVRPIEYLFAVKEQNGKLHSAGSILSGGYEDVFYPIFARLCVFIEEFMLTGKTPFPIEHTLLCTLAINAAMHALASSGERIETPHLAISYRL